MTTSNQVAAAKELLSVKKENHSLLKSLVFNAVRDSGTDSSDELFNQKCGCLHSFLIHWLVAPQYIAELEALMDRKEFLAALESIKSNVETHPKIAENLSADTIAITSLRLQELLGDFNELLG